MTRRIFACTISHWVLARTAAQDRSLKPKSKPAPEPGKSAVAISNRRAALVIGNNRYIKTPPLHNAGHDASDLAEALGRLRFEVRLVLDADKNSLGRAVQEFSSTLREGDTAFFFYAGHGLQIEEENYLLPVDFDPAHGEAGTKATCLRASEVQDAIKKFGAGLCIFVLDACRDNPFTESKSAPKGLALMEAGLGTYIGLATGPGQIARDNGLERNGLFTKYLLKEIIRPGQTIDQVFNNVKKQVFEASQQDQRPWLHSDIIGDFYFDGPANAMRPSSGSTLVEAGKRQFEARQFEEARKSFEQAMRVEPENPFIYNALGVTYTQLRQWSIATGLFAQAIELKPDYAAAYFNRGAAYHNAGRYELAVQDFSWAIEQEPFDPLVLDLRGKAYFSLNDYKQAKIDFDSAIKLNRTDSAALLGRGKVFFRTGSYEEAIKDLSASIRIRATAEAYDVRSQAYRATNRTALADADHQAALRLQQQ
jgi:tetratricopeptide (TPR) repeat protein